MSERSDATSYSGIEKLDKEALKFLKMLTARKNVHSAIGACSRRLGSHTCNYGNRNLNRADVSELV